MTAPLQDTNVTFENLISTCREAQERFRRAAAAAEDRAIRRLLSIYAQQRSRFALELLQELQGRAANSMVAAHSAAGTPAGALSNDETEHPSRPAQLDRTQPTDSTPVNDQELLRQCLLSDTLTLNCYRDALGARIPTRAHFLVSAQHALMQKAHERMMGMLQASTAPRLRMSTVSLAGSAL